MITMKELNPHGYPTTPVIEKNLALLLERMNELRAAYGKPMIVTSGLRSDAQQIAMKAAGKTTAGIGSKHCAGLACDISDPKGELKAFILADVKILERIGLWCEDFSVTTNWVHLQVIPPMSGKRFFMP